MTASPVYLDHAATTPVDERVIAAMTPVLTDTYANPNSLHTPGRDASRTLEDARRRFAEGIGAADPREVVFTGSGTESDNAALFGITAAVAPHGSRRRRRVLRR